MSFFNIFFKHLAELIGILKYSSKNWKFKLPGKAEHILRLKHYKDVHLQTKLFDTGCSFTYLPRP